MSPPAAFTRTWASPEAVARPRIHIEQDPWENQSLRLDPTASRHLAGALRLQVGDPVILFNGNGEEYGASIGSIERKQVTVEVG
ncbi:MAG: hypothetical protein O7F73_04535 [Gammaproteobacteria bacterium]|nr:hypothetical protein [Gammaproteobacteria bacterium]